MKRKALIYRPARNAMQSGTANTRRWKLEFVSDDRKFVEPVMGWIGSRDTTRQLGLTFHTQEEAIQYAQEMGLEYELRPPKQRQSQPKSYAHNFAYDRRQYSDIAVQRPSGAAGE